MILRRGLALLLLTAFLTAVVLLGVIWVMEKGPSPTLTALFRRRTGLPPHAFLVACRMAKAKEMLQSSRQSVMSVARQLNFPSAQHFATQFKRETGLTPSDWRRHNQPEKQGERT